MSIALRGVGLLATSVVLSVAIATPSGSVAPVGRPAANEAQPIDFVVPLPRSGAPAVAAASVATIPLWSGSIAASQNGKQYKYRMVGQDPRVPLTQPSTTIVAKIIPIVVKLANGRTFDPTHRTCGEKAAPLNAVLSSPIFKNTVFSPGGTNVGETQFADAFQRANFWAYTKPSGINPGYHVLLKPEVGKTITVKVPATDGIVVTKHACAGGAVKMIYAIAQGLRLLPTLAAKAWVVNPATFPIFLFHNVEFDQTLGGAGAVGFHAAIPNTAFHGATQTVAVASYLDAAFAPQSPDIAVLSHEIAEWMNDPLGTNLTPRWGNIGQVHAHCQGNLEVGDPLTRTTFPVTRNGVTYHPQEQAFFSWFYGPSPSIGVNGWFSFNGTFTRPAPICPPGGA